MKPIPDIILVALIVHPGWFMFMALSSVPLHTMAIDSSYAVAGNNPVVACGVLLAASLGAWMSHLERFHGQWTGFFLISGQQFLMLYGLWTIVACFNGWLVGDGIPRYVNGYAPNEGRLFIAADQLLFIIVTILHTRRVWNTYLTKA